MSQELNDINSGRGTSAAAIDCNKEPSPPVTSLTSASVKIRSTECSAIAHTQRTDGILPKWLGFPEQPPAAKLLAERQSWLHLFHALSAQQRFHCVGLLAPQCGEQPPMAAARFSFADARGGELGMYLRI